MHRIVTSIEIDVQVSVDSLRIFKLKLFTDDNYLVVRQTVTEKAALLNFHNSAAHQHFQQDSEFSVSC